MTEDLSEYKGLPGMSTKQWVVQRNKYGSRVPVKEEPQPLEDRELRMLTIERDEE